MSFAELLIPDEQELAEHYPSRVEKTADGLVHAVGMLAALIGGGVLVAVALTTRGVPMATASAIYALCLMAMLAASAVYNLSKPNQKRRILRRIDEAAIFLMIAGSYTPFTVKLLPPEFALFATMADLRSATSRLNGLYRPADSLAAIAAAAAASGAARRSRQS